jgi:hypothetical protein
MPKKEDPKPEPVDLTQLDATALLVEAVGQIEAFNLDRVLVVGFSKDGNLMKSIHNARSHAEYVGMLQLAHDNLGSLEVEFVDEFDEDEE